MTAAAQEPPSAPRRLRFVRRNLASSYAVYAASLVSGLAITPIIVRHLGKTEYGLWAFIGSLTVYLALLDLGVGPSVVRFAAAFRGREAPEEVSALASVGLVVYGLIGVATAAVAVPLAWLVPELIDIPNSLVWEARVVTLLVIAGIAARFPLGLFGNLLLGQQRYDLVNVANLASIAAYTALVAGVLTQTGGIVLLAWIALGTTIFRLALPLVWLRRELPFLRLSRRLVTRQRLRELLAFSWHNFLIHVSARVVFSGDVVVVGIVLGPVAAAYYAVPSKLFALAFSAGVAGTNVLYPAFAELEGAQELDRQREYLRTGLRGGMALILLVALPLVLVPDQLIRAWIGSGFGPSTWVMVLLGASLVAHQPAHVLSQYLIARGRQKALALVLVGTSAANLVLSVVLAQVVGLWGVALATLVTELAGTVVFIPRLVAEASGLSLRQLAVASLRPVVPALGVALLVLVAFARAYQPDTLLELVPLGALWLAACLPAVWRLGLSPEERRSFAHEVGLGGHALAPHPVESEPIS